MYGSQYVSYDGTTYTYRCPGQYTLTRLASAGYTFTASVLVNVLQATYQPYTPFNTTGLTDIVLQSSGCPLVQFAVSTQSSLVVYVNQIDISSSIEQLLRVTVLQPNGGRPFEYQGVYCVQAATIISTTELYTLISRYVATVVVISSSSCRIYFGSGVYVSVTVRTGTGSLSVSSHVPYSYRNSSLAGLFGDYNGLPGNDLRLPSGAVVGSNPSQVFYGYGPYCK